MVTQTGRCFSYGVYVKNAFTYLSTSYLISLCWRATTQRIFFIFSRTRFAPYTLIDFTTNSFFILIREISRFPACFLSFFFFLSLCYRLQVSILSSFASVHACLWHAAPPSLHVKRANHPPDRKGAARSHVAFSHTVCSGLLTRSLLGKNPHPTPVSSFIHSFLCPPCSVWHNKASKNLSF